MAIKKFQVQTPLVSPIGIVQPSMAGARAAQSLQQTGYSLAEQGYKLAVAEQQEVGREYAVQLQTVMRRALLNTNLFQMQCLLLQNVLQKAL